MSRIDAMIAQLGANPRLQRFIELGVTVLAALMIASFVANNAGRHYYLHRLFEANAGEVEALPEMVYQGITLARIHHLANVNLGPGLWEQPELYHRFGEGLYPIRLDRKSIYTLIGPKDEPGPSCQVVDQRPLVRLSRCL
jgi:hypothetical protein